MEKKSIYYNRKADKHAAVQNLRKFLREFLTGGGSRIEFARSMGMSPTQLNQYLSGIYTPTKHTIEKWSELLGVTSEEMNSNDFDYIPYPFNELFKQRVQSRHITKREVRQSYDAMIDEYVTMVREGEVTYEPKVEDLMKRYKI